MCILHSHQDVCNIQIHFRHSLYIPLTYLLIKLSEQLSTKTSVSNDDSYTEIVDALRKSSVGGIIIKDSPVNRIEKKFVSVKGFEAI